VTPSKFASYAEAGATLEALTPEISRRASAHALGFNPTRDAGVTILTYADVLQRFPVAAIQTSTDVTGIKRCVEAGTRRTGYLIDQSFTRRDRVGNFWADSFRFKQVTEITGWHLHAILLFVEDVLVFRQVGGRPRISQVEINRNPLGPLQSWGDVAAGAVTR